MSGLLPLLFALLAVDAGAPAVQVASEAPPPVGAPPEVALACAPSPVKVGQVLVCTLTVTHRPEVSFTVTAPPAFRTDTPAPHETLPDGRFKAIRTLRMQPLEPKESIKIGGLRVLWREASGGEAAISLPEQSVPISRVLVAEANPEFRTWETPGGDSAAFFLRHGPVAYRTTNWTLFTAVCIALGLVVGLGFGYLIRRWLEAHRKPPGPPVDPRPAHVIALEALDNLTHRAETEQMEVKVYYSRLSEIIRGYLERRYDFTALEMTSDEIRRQIIEMDPGYEARLAIDRFLDETDLVKFAAHLPGSGEADTVMLAARGLIQITRLTEEALATEGSA